MSTELANGQMNLLRRYTSRLTHKWKISRADGELPYLFTSHDQILNRSTEAYYDPRPGVSVTANRRVIGMGDATTELRGLIGDDGITYDDLHQGRLWGAEVSHSVHDWAFDFGPKVLSNTWHVTDIKYNDREWTLSLSGLTSKLKGRRGDVFSRLCQNQLGVFVSSVAAGSPTVSLCGVDIVNYPKTVPDAVVISSPAAPTKRTVYVQKSGSTAGFGHAEHIDSASAYSSTYFQGGYVVIRSGKLQGLQETIFTDERVSDTTRKLTFMQPLPEILAVSDTMNVTVGCDKNWQTCRDKFDHLQGSNGSGGFRGFPEIPGTDRATTYPPARGQ